MTLNTPSFKTASHVGCSVGWTGKIKCSRLCTKIIAMTANPLSASTTSIRGILLADSSI